MPWDEIWGIAASGLTMLAATMTASNLGARITGWGFLVFALGSIAWLAVAVMTGQQSLLVTNAFLLAVNVAGVWRWLGRQARYEKDGARAARRSRTTPAPTLFSLHMITGAGIADRNGFPLGVVVDAMLHCDNAGIAYVVVSDNALAGIDETLRALAPDQLRFGHDGVVATIDRQQFEALPALREGQWPVATPRGPIPARP